MNVKGIRPGIAVVKYDGDDVEAFMSLRTITFDNAQGTTTVTALDLTKGDAMELRDALNEFLA